MTLSDQTTAIRNAMIAFRNGGSYGCERGTGEPLPLYRDIPKGEIFPAGALVLLSHKATIFKTAKLREQIHEGDSCIRTRWWIWIAWLWRRVNRVLPLSLGV